MRVLNMPSPVRLCCLLIAVVGMTQGDVKSAPMPTLFAKNQQSQSPRASVPLILLRQQFQSLQKMRAQLTGGAQAGSLPAIRNSVCLKTPKDVTELFDDLTEALKGDDDDSKEKNTAESKDDDDDETTTMAGPRQRKNPVTMSADSSDDIDQDDVFEKISEKSLSCIEKLMDPASLKKWCQSVAHRPSNIKIFKKLLASGSNCIGQLRRPKNDSDEDDDDDDEFDLDDAQQSAILEGLRRRKNISDWDDDDFDQAIETAPDMLDDDILDDLPDSVLSKNIKKLGKLLRKGKGGAGLAIALQKRLRKLKPPSQMTKDDLNSMGDGLGIFDVDDIDDMDDDAFEGADLDFDDIDDDEPLGLAIGRKLRKANANPGNLNATGVRKLFKFVKSDRRFLNQMNPEALADSLDDIGDDDLDDDQASVVCKKIRESDEFDDASNITGAQLRKLGNVLKGCGKDFFDDLPPAAVREALGTIKNMDLDQAEARNVVRKMNFGESKDFTAATLRNMSKLLSALNTDELDDIPDSAFADTLDMLDDVDFDDAAEHIIIDKIKRGSAGKLPLALLKNKKLMDSLSLDDIDDLDMDDVLEKLAEINTGKFNRLVASSIVAKLMAKTGQANKKHSFMELESLGNLVVGLSEDDIDDITDDKEEVMNSASIMAKHDDDLRDGQSEAIAKKIKKVLGDGEVSMGETDALRVGKFIPYMKDDDSDKIMFTPEGGKAFMNVLSKMANSKLSKKKIEYLAKLAEKIIKKAKANDDDSLTAEDVRTMVGTFLGMPAAQIRSLTEKALLSNLEAFSKLPLSAEQGKAIVDKVEEFDDNYKCKSDRLAQLGANLKFLDDDKLKGLCKDQLSAAASTIIKNIEQVNEQKETRRKNGLGREEDDDGDDNARLGKVAIAISTSLTAEASRKRRAAGSGLTCDQIKIMGTQATKIPAADYAAMADAEFSNCLDKLGMLSDWSADHLSTLIELAKKVLYDHDTWKADTIKRVGSIIAGLSKEEISQLDLSSTDAMYNTGKHGLLSMDKLKAGFARWLNNTKNKDASTITGPELSSLSEYVCGADIAHIRAFNAEAFKQAIRTIGDAKTCRHDQLQEYAKKAVAAYGTNVNTWSGPVVSDLGRTIGGLQSPQVATMTSSQIKVLKPEIIPRLPSGILEAMSVEQLTYLSSNQANSITKAQYQALTASKQTTIQSKATVTFDSVDPAGGVDSVSPISCVIVLVVALVPSFFM